MGYDTNFTGHFTITPPLSSELVQELNLFMDTRKMKRDNTILMNDFQGEHSIKSFIYKNLPKDEDIYGEEGEFFYHEEDVSGTFNETHEKSILNGNKPPKNMPGLWCGWKFSKDGSKLKWNKIEKFYCYIDWLKYIRDTFLIPLNIVISGSVNFQGEDEDDNGIIICTDNKIKVHWISQGSKMIL